MSSKAGREENTMEYISGSTDFKFKNTVVTLGKFDGLHLGHQVLINKALECKKNGLSTVMFTFLLHPGNLFSDKDFELIYTEEEKVALAEHMGIDVLISYPFTAETRSMEPEDFIKNILVDQLDVKVIIVGKDFRFGYKRRGDVDLLKQYATTYGYQVLDCDKMELKEEVISSSLVRKAIKQGDIAVANEMLGYPYHITTEVVHGRRFGRTIGMPTINMIPAKVKLLPPLGVYVTATIIKGIMYQSVTNIGYKPTVGADDFIGVETFIIDYSDDLYGEVLEVVFYEFLRPELKFNSVEELIDRMKEDTLAAIHFFETNPRLLNIQ